MRTTGQFGGKQPRTIPQKLHECLAIIEQKTEPHYKAVACIDNKNINRVPEKELCKSVEATIDRVIQSCWTDHFISDSDVYFTVVILCNWHVRADRADDRQERFKKAAITILQYTNHHNFTGIQDFYLDNRDNTEFSSCLPETWRGRGRRGPFRPVCIKCLLIGRKLHCAAFLFALDLFEQQMVQVVDL